MSGTPHDRTALWTRTSIICAGCAARRFSLVKTIHSCYNSIWNHSGTAWKWQNDSNIRPRTLRSECSFDVTLQYALQRCHRTVKWLIRYIVYMYYITYYRRNATFDAPAYDIYRFTKRHMYRSAHSLSNSRQDGYAYAISTICPLYIHDIPGWKNRLVQWMGVWVSFLGHASCQVVFRCWVQWCSRALTIELP